MNEVNLVAGTIVFGKEVPALTVVGIKAILLQNGGNRWKSITVRRAGKEGKHNLDFVYLLKDGEQKTQVKAVNKLIQFLKDQLGIKEENSKVPKGVNSWCISTVIG